MREFHDKLDKLYIEFNRFKATDPTFTDNDNRMMFLFRQIVRIDMRLEEVIKKINLLLEVEQKRQEEINPSESLVNSES